MLMHLSAIAGYFLAPSIGNILGPLIMWLIKKDESEFVNDQGKEAINFGISVTIYLVVSGILFLIFVGILTALATVVLHIVCCIIAGTRAGKGEYYRYPLTIRILT